MKSPTSANTGTAIRSLLAWLLVVLVVANVAVWTAWPFRDQLVALGILAPPLIERVDLDPRALPPIVQRAEAPSDAHQGVDANADGEPDSDGLESVEPADPPDAGPAVSPSAPEIAARPAGNGRSPSSVLLDCVVVGPVESRAAIEAAETRLRSAGALVDSPEEFGVAALDYHVYVEPSASWNAARAVERELKAQSIEDTDIIPSGTYQNAVSVGVHRNRRLAEARRDRIAALGHAVKLRERHRLRARDVPADALGDLDYRRCPDHAAR